MTAYTPPNENLSSFNSSLFVSADSNLTISEADMLYYRKWISDLKYPILLNSNTFTGALNTFTNATIIAGTRIWGGNGLFGNNIYIVQDGSSNALSAGISNVAIGIQTLNTLTNGSQNTAVGAYAGGGIQGSSNYNTSIGSNSNSVNNSSAYDSTVAIGNNTNAMLTESVAVGNNANALKSYSIAIGSSSYNNFATSVALGAGATTTAINQIMLGTTNETTQILGALNVVKQATFTLPIQLPATYGTIASSTLMGYSAVANNSGVVMTSNIITNLQDITVPIGV